MKNPRPPFCLPLRFALGGRLVLPDTGIVEKRVRELEVDVGKVRGMVRFEVAETVRRRQGGGGGGAAGEGIGKVYTL